MRSYFSSKGDEKFLFSPKGDDGKLLLSSKGDDKFLFSSKGDDKWLFSLKGDKRCSRGFFAFLPDDVVVVCRGAFSRKSGVHFVYHVWLPVLIERKLVLVALIGHVHNYFHKYIVIDKMMRINWRWRQTPLDTERLLRKKLSDYAPTYHELPVRLERKMFRW